MIVHELPVEILIEIFQRCADFCGIVVQVHPLWRDIIDTHLLKLNENESKIRKTKKCVLLEHQSFFNYYGIKQKVRISSKTIINSLFRCPSNPLLCDLLFPSDSFYLKKEWYPLPPIEFNVVNYFAIFGRVDLLSKWANQPNQSFFIHQNPEATTKLIKCILFESPPFAVFEWFKSNYQIMFPNYFSLQDIIKNYFSKIMMFDLAPVYQFQAVTMANSFSSWIINIDLHPFFFTNKNLCFDTDQINTLLNNQNEKNICDCIETASLVHRIDYYFFNFYSPMASQFSSLFKSIMNHDLQQFTETLQTYEVIINKFDYSDCTQFSLQQLLIKTIEHGWIKGYQYIIHTWSFALNYITKLDFKRYDMIHSFILHPSCKNIESLPKLLMEIININNNQSTLPHIFSSVLKTNHADLICSFFYLLTNDSKFHPSTCNDQSESYRKSWHLSAKTISSLFILHFEWISLIFIHCGYFFKDLFIQCLKSFENVYYDSLSERYDKCVLSCLFLLLLEYFRFDHSHRLNHFHSFDCTVDKDLRLFHQMVPQLIVTFHQWDLFDDLFTPKSIQKIMNHLNCTYPVQTFTKIKFTNFANSFHESFRLLPQITFEDFDKNSNDIVYGLDHTTILNETSLNFYHWFFNGSFSEIILDKLFSFLWFTTETVDPIPCLHWLKSHNFVTNKYFQIVLSILWKSSNLDKFSLFFPQSGSHPIFALTDSMQSFAEVKLINYQFPNAKFLSTDGHDNSNTFFSFGQLIQFIEHFSHFSQ